mgnify:CR=1 FL=1
MTLREKLMHYTHDLDYCGSDLKQEAIATIEQLAQYMDQDELLNHSRPLALAYLALTEDVSAPVVHARWDDSGRYTFPGGSTAVRCTECGCALTVSEFRLNRWNYCPVCGAKMDGDVENVRIKNV